MKNSIKSRYAIVDFRIDEISLKTLSNYAEKIILTKKLNTYESICGHADIQVCKLDDNTIVTAPIVYEYYKSNLKGINVIKGKNNPGYNYPSDILYNAFVNSHIAIHNFKYTDEIILAQIEQKFLKRINVHQGYSKCSICELSDGSIITGDVGIYKSLNFNALLVNNKDIVLKGMENGFIGGALGYYKDTIFVNGNLNKYRDGEKVREFCNKHKTSIIELLDNKLEDIGSIIML